MSESLAEAAWRDRTIRHIVEATGGRFLDVAQDHAEVMARNMTTSALLPRIYRNAPRGVFTSFGVADSPALLPQMMNTVEKVLAPYKGRRETSNKGGPEDLWLWPAEGRTLWGENAVAADNDDPRSWADIMTYALEVSAENARKPVGMSAFNLSTDMVDTFEATYGANLWMRKVKSEFDPHTSSDGKLMPAGPISSLARGWPVIGRILRYAPWLMRLIVAKRIRAATKASRERAAALLPAARQGTGEARTRP